MSEELIDHVSPSRAVPAAKLVDTLDDGTKVKERIPRMRACDERNEKGKSCQGHLKRFFDFSQDLRSRFGNEIYRCERCRTLYLPHPGEVPRTETLSW